jgi:putative peptidoglycan lipid II flippase
MSENLPIENTQPETRMAGVARAAGIVAVANIVSRVLGMLRDQVKSYYFGASSQVSAFDLATKVTVMFYDLLAGGMVSSALVPVFSEYAQPARRRELWQVASFLLTLTVVVLAIFTILGELFASQIAWLIGGGQSPEALALTTQLLRITLPAMLFLNLAGILSGLLYALKRFTLPAFNSSIFNLSIVLVTIIFAKRWGVYALAVGLLLGALAQVLLQLPALRDSQLRPLLDWKHPALQKIARLYLPIAVGLVVDLVSRTLSYRLATETGPNSVAWMGYATTLMQFPLGLTSTAVAVAILPTLSRQAQEIRSHGNHNEFLATLAQGIRLVLVLIIPATVGLFVLAKPIIVLIFEHGEFTRASTDMTAFVLHLYLLGVIWAAVDLLLVNAFYAQQDAWTPAMVGLVCVAIYLAVALLPALLRPLQLQDLMIANAVQLTCHTIIMAWLLQRRVGGLGGHGLTSLTAKALIASLAMGLLSGWVYRWVGGVALGGILGEVVQVAIPGALGAVCYFALLWLLRVPEVGQLVGMVQRKLGRAG